MIDQKRIELNYLPDGLPEYYFHKKKSDPEKFKEKHEVEQPKFFLYIGRLHRLKGPQLIVKALKALDNPDVGAVFIGPDDGYKNELISRAKKLGVFDRTKFLGVVDEDTKIDAIDSSIAVVVPSFCDYVETFSLVISEAWARGKPVIVSNAGELPYRVDDSINGIVVNPDSRSIAKAMTNIPGVAMKIGGEEKKALNPRRR